MSNDALHKANKQKNDEFYTQLSDIEKELKHYKDHFKNKVVLCNCDDPRVSNFFHYFSYNFEKLGLKKLITTCFKNKRQDRFSKHDTENAVYLEYEGDRNGNKIPDTEEIEIKPLDGDGDFRSKECIELLKHADIVVTNPPFSLFREYVAQLMKFNKKFIILGNQNATKYKEIFKLIKENKIWLGVDNGGTKWFQVPKDYKIKTKSRIKIQNGKKYFSMGSVIWLTNLDITKRHEDLILYKEFNSEDYPTYDNYSAINVDKVREIPFDYSGIMGVPLTFLYKYNPSQFEILGITAGRDDFEVTPIKRYINAIQVKKDGTTVKGSKVNTTATLLCDRKPLGTYYIADNVDGFLKSIYARVLIRNREIRA